ncbi:MAG: FitA-like ribbon-helix-helix domain-containing protein [Rudaea sp.]
MPDILVRNIDEAVAERIKTIARERGWSINEVIVHVLRHSLGFGGEDIVRREIHDVAELGGTWNPQESTAFRKALEAFERIDGEPLFVGDPKAPGQAPK